MTDEDGPDRVQPLHFQSDRGSSRGTWIAILILLGVVGWMGSGFLVPGEDPATKKPASETPPPPAVATRVSTAEPVTLFFQAEGQALPDRETQIRAEASGDVAELLVAKGDDVEKGAVIARLSSASADADLVRAREDLAAANREFENAEKLLDRGVATQDRVTAARQQLASAQAAVTAAEEALDSLDIVAPFAGRVESLTLDPGEFVQKGADVGRIVDNQPLTVAIQVPQQALRRVSDGQPAKITFITGEEREGIVTFVGTSANAETRTFLAEIDVENSDGQIPAGISAEVRIPTGETLAHFVRPSIVSLSPEGRPVVKTVDEANKVVTFPIEVARAEIDGIWITGLPEKARIITIGQGFVNAGETVSPSAED